MASSAHSRRHLWLVTWYEEKARERKQHADVICDILRKGEKLAVNQ
jgi:hypothetical protein